MLTELTVTAKGQVTLKKSVLEHLGVKPGEKVSVSLRPGGSVELLPAVVKKKRNIADLAGLLYRPGQRTISIDEMNEAIAAEAVAQDERIR